MREGERKREISNEVLKRRREREVAFKFQIKKFQFLKTRVGYE